MRPHALAFTALILALAGAAAAQQAPTSKSKAGRDLGDAASGPVGATSAATVGSMNAKAFVQNAARSDMYEIQSAKLAEQKSQNPQIKDFAQMMVKDHTQTTQNVMAALPPGITAPTDLDKRRQGMLDNLMNSPAGEFDKRYVAQQVAAHKEALTLMRGYAKRGDNAQLKMVASMTVPIIEKHLQAARKLPGAPK